ncbi:PepSY-associated TM helix domain-containing protein [Algoriphagus limi]|uniref:PepSY domain-containing protein n=1 Tax=Algoriphagus limi TaxID=2975273 RepID=A0ABT2G416_9BACT|nr:PepSY-associated TM helix domain-containing protein [Algoriphagus limi]MCS5490021.1 PepSY domain-containing protein [Algoriphagus limi]
MARSKSTWKTVRKLFNDIHLYAGLISGIIVILVCLSGTIYVYNTEIKEWADSERYFVEPSGEMKSLDELKSGLESQLNGEVTAAFVHEDADRSVQFTLLKEGEKGRGTTYFVNPYTGEILADNSERTAAEEFMSTQFSLHRWLLIDRIEEPILESMSNRELGRLINGIATSLFLLGVLTGMVIWVPQKVKSWKQGLKIKWSGNWKRINHDLHNTLAFYSLTALFIMSATGLFWSFQWYREGWQKTWDTYQAPREAKKGEEAEKVVPGPALDFSLDQAVSKANEALPYAGNLRISLPQNDEQAISINKYRTGFFARAGADQLTLNQADLSVSEMNLFSDMSTRQQIGRSVKSLHTGEIFGSFTKFIWFIACLIATSLPITGTLIWWNKRKKKKSSKKRKVKERQMEFA